MLGAVQWRGGRGDVWGGVASTAFAWKVCYDVDGDVVVGHQVQSPLTRSNWVVGV